MSLLLGVNIDHVATLRQARYAKNPDAPIVEPNVLTAALEAARGGADSLTIHVREDQRHMQREDAFHLRDEQSLPLNLEMATTPEMLAFALEVEPTFACLVPEKREEVTTEGGLDVLSAMEALRQSIPALQGKGIKVSLFIDPEPEQIAAAADLGAEMIELHTGAFALATGDARAAELERLIAGARQAHGLGLQVNGGHGIHYDNLDLILQMPHLVELNIGHAIVSRAVFVGLQQAVREMKDLMQSGKEGLS